jgi:hypothetical protein
MNKKRLAALVNQLKKTIEEIEFELATPEKVEQGGVRGC